MVNYFTDMLISNIFGQLSVGLGIFSASQPQDLPLLSMLSRAWSGPSKISTAQLLQTTQQIGFRNRWSWSMTDEYYFRRTNACAAHRCGVTLSGIHTMIVVQFIFEFLLLTLPVTSVTLSVRAATSFCRVEKQDTLHQIERKKKWQPKLWDH